MKKKVIGAVKSAVKTERRSVPMRHMPQLVISDAGRKNAGYCLSRNDCAVRAVSTGTRHGYKKSFESLALKQREVENAANPNWEGKKMYDLLRAGPNFRTGVTEDALEEHLIKGLGWQKHADRKRIDHFPAQGTYIVAIPPQGGNTAHVAAIRDGKLYDDWDSRTHYGVPSKVSHYYVPPAKKRKRK